MVPSTKPHSRSPSSPTTTDHRGFGPRRLCPRLLCEEADPVNVRPGAESHFFSVAASSHLLSAYGDPESIEVEEDGFFVGGPVGCRFSGAPGGLQLPYAPSGAPASVPPLYAPEECLVGRFWEARRSARRTVFKSISFGLDPWRFRS